jgi:glutathione synthase/RimK-type ligase-like ATP-grasp enzyme
MKVGFVTCKDLSRFFMSKENPLLTHDDQVVADELQKRGHAVIPIPWGSPIDGLRDLDLMVVRSPWDYMDSPENRRGFFLWLKELQSVGLPLKNDVGLMLWNLDKQYLGDLAIQGVPVVPTRFVPPGELTETNVKSYFDENGPVVLKPCVSAGARDTFLIKTPQKLGELEDLNGKVGGDFESFQNGRFFMMQPFFESVQSFGEWSLIFFNGEYSHSVRKIPKSGGWLVQDELGGTVRSEEAPQDVIAQASNAVTQISAAYKYCSGRELNDLPFYARIDLLHEDSGEALIGEVELVEPELFFLNRDPLPLGPNKKAVNLFCDLIEKY